MVKMYITNPSDMAEILTMIMKPSLAEKKEMKIMDCMQEAHEAKMAGLNGIEFSRKMAARYDANENEQEFRMVLAEEDKAYKNGWMKMWTADAIQTIVEKYWPFIKAKNPDIDFPYIVYCGWLEASGQTTMVSEEMRPVYNLPEEIWEPFKEISGQVIFINPTQMLDDKAYIEINTNEIEVDMDFPRPTILDPIFTVAHECRHLHQFKVGDYKPVVVKTGGGNYIPKFLWKGKEFKKQKTGNGLETSAQFLAYRHEPNEYDANVAASEIISAIMEQEPNVYSMPVVAVAPPPPSNGDVE